MLVQVDDFIQCESAPLTKEQLLNNLIVNADQLQINRFANEQKSVWSPSRYDNSSRWRIYTVVFIFLSHMASIEHNVMVI